MQEQDPKRKDMLRLKYGISVNNPELRRRQLQAGNSNLIKLLWYWKVKNMGEVENSFKSLLDQYKIQQGAGGKEWFEVPLALKWLIFKCLTNEIGSPKEGNKEPSSPKHAMGRGNLQKKGYIYIISEENDLHGCRVKVGATERDPTERVAELQTGNSNLLILRAYVRVTNMGEAEKRIHKAMMGGNLRQGITGGTEWFKCESLQEAVKYLDLIN